MGAVALRSEDLFHTGIVVDDLAEAQERIGCSLGLTWRTGGADVRLITDDGARTVPSAYALSCEGPHHVELVQAVEDTLWTVTGAGHAHHLGWWVDDVNAMTSALREGGAVHLATIAMADDAPPMCAYLRMPDGLCVEVVNRRFKKVLLPDPEATQ
jgi:hypothetical protein